MSSKYSQEKNRLTLKIAYIAWAHFAIFEMSLGSKKGSFTLDSHYKEPLHSFAISNNSYCVPRVCESCILILSNNGFNS